MSNEPTLVVLGASGDLAARLLFPALLSLEHRERLEDLKIIGYARQEWTDRAVPREPARRDRHAAASTSTRSTSTSSSTASSSTVATSRSSRCAGLKSVLDGPAIFYLALPPGVFADAAETIAKAGLADETNGLSPARDREAVRHRSRDRARAQRAAAHALARRPDLPDRPLPRQGDGAEHARVPVREPVHRAGAATPRHVDEIQITVAETLGVEGRSRYYDGIGALRDMVQNHLIQMMTFATMEPPALWDAEMIRDHKVEVLKSVHARRSRRRRGARSVHRRPRRGRAAHRRTGPSRASIPTSHTDTFAARAAARRHLALGRRAGAVALGQAARGEGARGRVPLPGAADALVPAHAARARRAELAGVPHEPVRVHRARRAHQAARPRARGARVGAPRRVRRRRRPRGDARTSRCCSTCWRATTRRSCASTRSSGRGASSTRCSRRGSTGAPEDYVAGSDGPAGQHRFLGARPLLAAAPEPDLLSPRPGSKSGRAGST